jgi:hypothetical protein
VSISVPHADVGPSIFSLEPDNRTCASAEKIFTFEQLSLCTVMLGCEYGYNLFYGLCQTLSFFALCAVSEESSSVTVSH